jgi:hypothetical protein
MQHRRRGLPAQPHHAASARGSTGADAAGPVGEMMMMPSLCQLIYASPVLTKLVHHHLAYQGAGGGGRSAGDSRRAWRNGAARGGTRGTRQPHFSAEEPEGLRA